MLIYSKKKTGEAIKIDLRTMQQHICLLTSMTLCACYHTEKLKKQGWV
jgi:hypothetical protein